MKRRQGNRRKEETTNKDNKMLTNTVDINPAISVTTFKPQYSTYTNEKKEIVRMDHKTRPNSVLLSRNSLQIWMYLYIKNKGMEKDVLYWH